MTATDQSERVMTGLSQSERVTTSFAVALGNLCEIDYRDLQITGLLFILLKNYYKDNFYHFCFKKYSISHKDLLLTGLLFSIMKTFKLF